LRRRSAPAVGSNILNSAEEFQNELVKYNEADPKLQRSRAVLLRETSQTLLFQGDREDAIAHALRARDIMNALPESELVNPDVKRELSHTYNRIGEALSKSNRHREALDSYRKALDIREDLASEQPTTDHRLEVALCYERIGDELRSLRLHQESLRAYQASFEIRREIAAAEPENEMALGVLAVSYDRIGMTAGNPREAMEAYSKGRSIRERLVNANPRNARWQSDLANSHDYIATRRKTDRMPESDRPARHRVLAEPCGFGFCQLSAPTRRL
jgi:tetratricopeptide (TPR) repeat protein